MQPNLENLVRNTVLTKNLFHLKIVIKSCFLFQIARAFREVVNRAGNDSSPRVICGDFNSFPQAPGYQLASEGYLSDSRIHFLQSSKTMEMPDGTVSFSFLILN